MDTHEGKYNNEENNDRGFKPQATLLTAESQDLIAGIEGATPDGKKRRASKPKVRTGCIACK